MEIIAHRGFADNVHENTLDAFAKAITAGADRIECDVRQTADNQLIIFHDAQYGPRPIGEYTWPELKSLAQSNGLIIPTFDESLAFCQNKIKLNIEIKLSGYEREVVRVVEQYLQPADYFISSFQDEVIYILRTHYPQIPCGLLLDRLFLDPRYWQQNLRNLFPQQRLEKLKPCCVVLSQYLLNFGVVKRLREWNATLPIYCWTVNAESVMKKCLSYYELAGIITDKVASAIEYQKTWNKAVSV